MSAQDKKARNAKLLRYGELVAKKARAELAQQPVDANESAEMVRLQEELELSSTEIIHEIETLVKKNY